MMNRANLVLRKTTASQTLPIHNSILKCCISKMHISLYFKNNRHVLHAFGMTRDHADDDVTSIIVTGKNVQTFLNHSNSSSLSVRPHRSPLFTLFLISLFLPPNPKLTNPSPPLKLSPIISHPSNPKHTHPQIITTWPPNSTNPANGPRAATRPPTSKPVS